MAVDPTEPIECAAIFVVRDIASSLAYYRDARILKAPASYPYGMRDFDVLDLNGNRLVFGSSDP